MKRLELTAKLAALPDSPGCYIMKDANGKIIYVGKAKSLKNRVRQYFTGAHDFKTTRMVANIGDFDYVLTRSEKEALLLEINLIKQHAPQFNIMFMDDKSYPYIKMTTDSYPALRIVREKKQDKRSLYFGPYPDATAARKTIDLLNQIYPIRKCRTMPKKVCLYYHLGQCLGPCEYPVDKQAYDRLVSDLTKVLRGDVSELIAMLKQRMMKASECMEYEKAQEYHQLIQSVLETTEKQRVHTVSNIDQDIWHYYADKGYICIQLMSVRSGKLLKKKTFLEQLYEEEEDALMSYIGQYYHTNAVVKEIILPQSLDCEVLDDEILTRVIQPHHGQRADLLKIAYKNAVEYLNRKFTVVNLMNEQNDAAQRELSELLKKDIETIEVFDNSHISGSNPVSGMVVFINGKPSRKNYRKFRLHQSNDDVASMKEVIYRRYFRLLREGLDFPDLILVDGGYAQVKAAREVIDSLQLEIMVMGLMKDSKHNTSGLVNVWGDCLELDKDSALFFFLARIQDEVHRFAITYHRQRRLKQQTKSILDDIAGIGENRKKSLMRHFGSFKKLLEADVDKIAEVIPKEVAKRVFETLHAEDDSK